MCPKSISRIVINYLVLFLQSKSNRHPHSFVHFHFDCVDLKRISVAFQGNIFIVMNVGATRNPTPYCCFYSFGLGESNNRVRFQCYNLIGLAIETRQDLENYFFLLIFITEKFESIFISWFDFRFNGVGVQAFAIWKSFSNKCHLYGW